MESRPGGIAEAHAPKAPNDLLALYLDRSIALPEPIWRAWQADSSSPARQ
jgi:hypothetical protein